MRFEIQKIRMYLVVVLICRTPTVTSQYTPLSLIPLLVLVFSCFFSLFLSFLSVFVFRFLFFSLFYLFSLFLFSN